MTFAAGIVTLSLAAGERSLVLQALQPSADERRIELVDVHLGVERGCTPVRVTIAEPPRGSGVVGFGVEGTSARGSCAGRGWARVRVYSKVWVTTRALRSSEGLGGAVTQVEREVGAGVAPLPRLEAGALAARSLARGVVLEQRHVRGEGPAAGERLTVVVELGAIHLEQEGIALLCPRACARLANGQRVEGELVDGKLKVTP